jgi:hypothetical protein
VAPAILSLLMGVIGVLIWVAAVRTSLISALGLSVPTFVGAGFFVAWGLIALAAGIAGTRSGGAARVIALPGTVLGVILVLVGLAGFLLARAAPQI